MIAVIEKFVASQTRSTDAMVAWTDPAKVRRSRASLVGPAASLVASAMVRIRAR